MTVVLSGANARGDTIRLAVACPDVVYAEEHLLEGGPAPSPEPEAVPKLPPEMPRVAAATATRSLRIPSYGSPGTYCLGLVLSRGDSAQMACTHTFSVVGTPLPPKDELAIEASSVNGQSGRRVAIVDPGPIAVRVRVAGYTLASEKAVSRIGLRATAVLRHQDGRPLSRELPVGSLEGVLPYRPHRVDIEGTIELPAVPSADLLLELRVHDLLAGRMATLLRHVAMR